MAPLALCVLMLCALAGVSLWAQADVAAASGAALAAQSDAKALSELRSTSRSLERDAINLITETDPIEREIVIKKFDDRLAMMAHELEMLAAQTDQNFVGPEFLANEQRVLDALKATGSKAVGGDPTGAHDDFRREVRPATRAASKIVDRTIEALDHKVDALKAASEAVARFAQVLLLLATALTATVASVSGYLIIRRSVVVPLHDLRAAMDHLAAGRTGQAIPHIGRTDEVGQMAQAMAKFRNQLAQAERAGEAQVELIVSSIGIALDGLARGDLTARVDSELVGRFANLKSDFNRALDAIGRAMTQVNSASAGINGGAFEIRQASDDLALRTEQQAANIEETSAALEEVTRGVRRTADGANAANVSIGQAEAQANQGREVVGEAVTAMAGIERSAQEIAQILTVIDGIAFQTNLLALNAGVEAARAGDSGRGFAVVANEVRALAQRSADAAADIKRLITASGHEVAHGVQLVGRTGEAFARISAQITEISGLVAGISSLAGQQATNLQQVTGTVQSMNLATQQNAAMVEQANAAARSLADEAARLDALVAQFNLSDGHDQATIAPVRRRA